MKKALVFGGGGAKGAYEIGVWKALRELNIDVDIVCGTSIGALIGAMYVQDDFEKAWELWNHLKARDVIKDGVSIDSDIDLLMSQKSKYKDIFSSFLSNRGADISPFINMIDHMFDADKFFASTKDFGCLAVKVKGFEPTTFIKSNMDKDKAKAYLLASASCFPAFPLKEIEGEKYMDGGYHENVPIHIAYELGADFIIAIDLSISNKKEKHFLNKNILYINPSVPLGSFLNFETKQIQRNITLGYLDTQKKFDQIIGYLYSFHKSSSSDIVRFDQEFNTFITKHHSFIHKSISDYLYEELFNRSMDRKEDKLFESLRLIELAAYTYDLDILTIYDFNCFQQILLKKFESTPFHEYSGIKKLKAVRQIAKDIKELSKKDIIHYLFQRLCIEEVTSKDDLNYLSLMFRFEYTIALVFYMLQSKQNGT